MFRLRAKQKSCALTVLSVLLVVSSVGCVRAQEEDLPGTYRISKSWGEGELTLFDDGTYAERIVLKSGIERSVTGEWEFSTDRWRLVRRPCLDIDHRGFQGLVDFCRQGVTRYLLVGGIDILMDPDWDVSYSKN